MTAPIDLSLKLDDGEVTARLAALAAAGEDLTPAMGAVSAYLVAQIEVRFKTETAPDGVPWIKSRRALGLTGNKGTGQTLSDKGFLRNSMKQDFGRDYAAAGPENSGASAEYAAAHQFGFHGPVVVPFHKRTVKKRFGKKLAEPQTEFVSSYVRQMNLPARSYLGFGPDDGTRVLDILEQHMAGALGAGA